MATSLLTPLQLTAGAGLLQNEGISPHVLIAAVDEYVSTDLIAPLANTFITATTGNILTANTRANLTVLAANTCSALSDSIPSGYSGYPTEFMSTLLTNTANTYLGNGDNSKFVQAFSIAQSYGQLTNQFIDSAKNATTYLGPTFTNTDDMISGGITAVNLCTEQWGADLANLGLLINLDNLDELGTPMALIKQLANVGGLLPIIAITFSAFGVSEEAVVNLTNPDIAVTDVDQKAMYAAMTQITGDTLTQVLKLLGVNTAGINTMADLLNPVKIFPNSFQTLTVTDINNVSQRIYLDSAGTVNPVVAAGLPTTILSSVV